MFIKNFSRVAVLLTSILWITDKSNGNGSQSTLTNTNKKNQGTSSGIGNYGGIDRDIKNLSFVVKSAKSKKPNFAKANSSKIEFLTCKAKNTCIYLQKAFNKASIFWHFDPKRHIHIETDTLGYIISEVLSQVTSDHLDQLFFQSRNLQKPRSNFLQVQNSSIVSNSLFSQKIILAKSQYETHDQELLAIIKAFKI